MLTLSISLLFFNNNICFGEEFEGFEEEDNNLARRLSYYYPPLCSPSVCVRCNADGIHCDECIPDYFHIKWDSECVRCNHESLGFHGCKQCATDAGCIACDYGFQLRWDSDEHRNKCFKVEQCEYGRGCSVCNSAGGFCEQCDYNCWKLEWDGFCKFCWEADGNCKHCDNYVGCTECDYGYDLTWSNEKNHNICVYSHHYYY